MARTTTDRRADRQASDEDEWGPTVERRSSRAGRHLRRMLLLLLAVVLVVLLVVPFVIASRIPRIPVDGLAAGGSPLNVLVVGSDSREGLTADDRARLSTGRGDGGERTDTIFVLQVHRGTVGLLAFPRDLWVERCDGSVGRINVAHSIGGPSCLVTTVSRLSGLDLHGYATVGFGGFVDVVDAVGGVELCLEDAIRDRDAGIDLPAGCQRLDGGDALGYVRVRKIDNDLERIRRQQRFLRALATEVASPGVLLNPLGLWRLSSEIGDALVLDEGLGVLDLGRLAWGAWGLANDELVAHTVPADPGITPGGASVLYVREQEAEALFARFRDGSVLDEAGRDLTADDVRVTVLNGAQVSGLAGRVGDLLAARGYQVDSVGNADVRDATVILHPPGGRQAAALVAGDLPGDPALQQTTDVSHPTVVLGRDAAGVQ